MQAFFQQHTREIIWLLSVAGGTVLLLFLNRKLFAWLNRLAKKHGRNDPTTFRLLQRIAAVFLYVLGVGLASYVFLNESVHAAITQNLRKIIWLTLVAVFTIGLAASVKLIFDRFIREATREDTALAAVLKTTTSSWRRLSRPY